MSQHDQVSIDPSTPVDATADLAPPAELTRLEQLRAQFAAWVGLRPDHDLLVLLGVLHVALLVRGHHEAADETAMAASSLRSALVLARQAERRT